MLGSRSPVSDGASSGSDLMTHVGGSLRDDRRSTRVQHLLSDVLESPVD